MTDERGFTLIELLVSILTFVVVLSAILMMTTVATHDQNRIAKRVSANQRARPVMTHLIDELHSACIAPRFSPVLAGTSTSITFLSKAGSDVTPVPDKHTVTLANGTLSEVTSPGIPGTSPQAYGSAQTTTLLTNALATTGVPVFRYYRYSGSQLSAISLPNPTSTLSADDAAATVKVDVTFTAAPPGGVSTLDPKSPLSISDSATFRLEAPSTSASAVNGPCT
jgi:type II secretory pathway pseudopilin PulG